MIGDELFGMNLMGESGASFDPLVVVWALTMVDHSFRDGDDDYVLI